MGKELKLHSVKYNLIMNIILKLSTIIFPFITFPYISRVLGAEYNGKIAFASSVVYYFTFIASLGIPTYGVKVCAQCRDNKLKLTKTVKELLIISSITTIFSYLLFILALIFVPKFQEEKTLMIINAMGIILSVYGVEWFYQAIEQYDYITYRNIAFKVISIALMFLFVHETEDYLLYASISVLSGSGANILNLIRLNKYVNLKDKTDINIRMHIKPILTLFMLSAASTVYTSLDSVMIGFIANDYQVGIYSSAVKVKTILVSVVTSLGVVLLPRLSNELANGREDQFNQLIKKSFNFSLLISIPLALFSIYEAEKCILFLAGEGYRGSIIPMQLISPSIIFIALSNIIGIQILIPNGKEFYTFLSTLAGAVVNLILNAFLIYHYQSSGAALATTVAEFAVLAVQIYMVRNDIYKYVELNNFKKIYISAFFSSIVVLLFDYFVIINSLFIGIITSALIFFGSYILFGLLTKEKIIQNFVFSIIFKLNKKYKRNR